MPRILFVAATPAEAAAAVAGAEQAAGTGQAPEAGQAAAGTGQSGAGAEQAAARTGQPGAGAEQAAAGAEQAAGGAEQAAAGAGQAATPRPTTPPRLPAGPATRPPTRPAIAGAAYHLYTWQGRTPAGAVTVLTAGIGPAAAAAATATLLAADGSAIGYDLLLSVGIAGGLPPALPGDVVVSDRIVHADLGADSPDGFLTGESLGWGTVAACPRYAVELVAARAAGAGLTVHVGPVATVSTVTGTAVAAARLARTGALAEAMEGAGVAAAAAVHGVPALEVRGVSNAVGPRDRAAWQVATALAALTRAVAALLGRTWPDLEGPS